MSSAEIIDFASAKKRLLSPPYSCEADLASLGTPVKSQGSAVQVPAQSRSRLRELSRSVPNVLSGTCVSLDLSPYPGVVFHNNPIPIFHIISALVRQIFSRYSIFFHAFSAGV